MLAVAAARRLRRRRRRQQGHPLLHVALVLASNENGTPLNVITVQRLGGDGEVERDGRHRGRQPTSGRRLRPRSDSSSPGLPATVSRRPSRSRSSRTTTTSPTRPSRSASRSRRAARRSATRSATRRSRSSTTTSPARSSSHARRTSSSRTERRSAARGHGHARRAAQDGVVTATVVMTERHGDERSGLPRRARRLHARDAHRDVPRPGHDPGARAARRRHPPGPASRTGRERSTLELSNPTGGATIGATSPATVTIIDDDNMLEIPNPAPGTLFGATVAKVGSKLLIGAPGNAAPEGRVVRLRSLGWHARRHDHADRLDRVRAVARRRSGTLAIGAPGRSGPSTRTRSPTASLRSPPRSPAAIVRTTAARRRRAARRRLIGGAPRRRRRSSYDALTGAPLATIAGPADSELGTAFALFGSELLIGAPGGAGAVFQYSGDAVRARDDVRQPDARVALPRLRPRARDGRARLGDLHRRAGRGRRPERGRRPRRPRLSQRDRDGLLRDRRRPVRREPAPAPATSC